MKKIRKRSQKGGVWKKLIQTAIVPLVLIGLRNSFTRKRSKNGDPIHKKRK